MQVYSPTYIHITDMDERSYMVVVVVGAGTRPGSGQVGGGGGKIKIITWGCGCTCRSIMGWGVGGRVCPLCQVLLPISMLQSFLYKIIRIILDSAQWLI